MVGKLRALLLIGLCLPLTGAWPNTGRKYPQSSYTGPGDIVASATAWWGLRAYTAAIAAAATQKVVNLNRASDSHTCDIIIATSGGLGNTANCSTGGDNGQSASSFCNATTCSVTDLYDQSGALACTGATACDIVQATVSNQPAFTFSCQNGFACVDCTSLAHSTILTSNNSLTVNQPFTTTSAAEPTTTAQGSGGGRLYSGTNGNIQFIIEPTPTQWSQYAGTEQKVATTLNAWYALQPVYNGASSTFVINGSANATNPGTNGFNSDLSVCNYQGALTSQFGGDVGETGIWSSAFNSTQYGSMNTNIRNYWNF